MSGKYLSFLFFFPFLFEKKKRKRKRVGILGVLVEKEVEENLIWDGMVFG